MLKILKSCLVVQFEWQQKSEYWQARKQFKLQFEDSFKTDTVLYLRYMSFDELVIAEALADLPPFLPSVGVNIS